MTYTSLSTSTHSYYCRQACFPYLSPSPRLYSTSGVGDYGYHPILHVNFHYTEAHLAHRNHLYSVINKSYLTQHYKSCLPLLVGIYWRLEHYVNNMDSLLNRMNLDQKDSHYLRAVLFYLENEALQLIGQVNSHQIDVRGLVHDKKRLDYTIISECIDNDIYCYVMAVKECFQIERLCASTGREYLVTIEGGNYLLFFEFNVGILEALYASRRMKRICNYVVDATPSWLTQLCKTTNLQRRA